jgi:hypothetical protein
MIQFIGIDLGQKGALTVQRKIPGSKIRITIYPFWDRHGGTRQRTLMDHEFIKLFETVLSNGESYVAIEHPIFMPMNGKKAIASIHEAFGLVKGICMAFGADHFWFPKPREWKAVVNAPGNDKSKMTKIAARICTSQHLNDLTSDSVLISEACRLHFQTSKF